MLDCCSEYFFILIENKEDLFVVFEIVFLNVMCGIMENLVIIKFFFS